MAAIGAYQARYGNPFPSGKKGNPLPWTTAATVDADGCAYASAILNMVDSMGALAQSSSALNSSVSAIQSVFQTAIYQACDFGCQNTAVPIAGWVASGCTVAGAPARAARRRFMTGPPVTGLASDLNSCAVAGIVNFINVAPAGWLDGP